MHGRQRHYCGIVLWPHRCCCFFFFFIFFFFSSMGAKWQRLELAVTHSIRPRWFRPLCAPLWISLSISVDCWSRCNCIYRCLSFFPPFVVYLVYHQPSPSWIERAFEEIQPFPALTIAPPAIAQLLSDRCYVLPCVLGILDVSEVWTFVGKWAIDTTSITAPWPDLTRSWREDPQIIRSTRTARRDRRPSAL